MDLLNYIKSINKPFLFEVIFSVVIISTQKSSQGILRGQVISSGLRNGPYMAESPLNYLIDPSQLSQSAYLTSSDSSALRSANFLQSNNQPIMPLEDFEKTIAIQLLPSVVQLKDGESKEIESNQEDDSRENARLKFVQMKDGLPKGTILVYRGGGSEGISSILKDIISDENGKNAYNGEDEDEEGDNDSAIVVDDTSKPGSIVIKKIVRGKDGKLTVIEWNQDKGHKKHGWKNSYHKEEWGDSQQKHDFLRDKGWLKRFKGTQGREMFEGQSVRKSKGKGAKKKTKKAKNKSNKGKQQKSADNKDDGLVSVGNGYRIPQILWSYLSQKNGQDSLPIQDLTISQA